MNLKRGWRASTAFLSPRDHPHSRSKSSLRHQRSLWIGSRWCRHFKRFMTAEHDHRRIPDWAQREHVLDQAWIAENLSIFEPAARTAFAQQGRGAFLVDTTVCPPGLGHPFA